MPDATPDDQGPADVPMGADIDVETGVSQPASFPFQRSADSTLVLSADQAKIIEAVVNSIDAGRAQLAAARLQAAAGEGGQLQRHSVSLVLARQAVEEQAGSSLACSGLSTVFVRWEIPASRRGRPVRIDSMNRIIFQLLSPCDFSDAEILIPDIGALMDKARGAQRTKLPDWVVAVKAAADAKLNAGPEDTAPCTACVVSGRHGVEAPSTALDGDAFVCHSCLCCFHVRCNEILAQTIRVDARPCLATEHGVSFECCRCASF